MAASPKDRLLPVALLGLALALPGVARAGATPPTDSDKAFAAAGEAAHKALVRGPSTIEIKDEARLALPAGMGFIPRKEASELLRLMGNTVGERFVGLIVPIGEDHAHWFVRMDYEPEGYVKDDDAKHWDADALLKKLQDGTEAGNARRAAMGMPAIKVNRWIEVPAYEAATHRLMWSAEVVRKDAGTETPTINYNTYVLGRDGYLSMDLVTGADRIDAEKPVARQLLGQVSYNSGKDYRDFDSSTDKVAAYGLAALIGGVALKKLGLLAVMAATIVKFAKVIMIAVAGVGAALAKWFKSRGKAPAGPGA